MDTNDWTGILREAMNASGLSYYELARRSGVDVASVQRFSKGEMDFTLKTAAKIGPIVGVSFIHKGAKMDKAEKRMQNAAQKVDRRFERAMERKADGAERAAKRRDRQSEKAMQRKAAKTARK